MGCLYALRGTLKERGEQVKGQRVAVQGFGNVGSNAARLLHADGAKIVAVSDVKGGVRNPEGLDIPALLEWVKQKRSVAGFPGTDACTNDELLTTDCDVLVPAALGGVLTRRNAGDVRARIVLEGANHPTDPDADEVLEKKGVWVIPDIYANAGGVTVSYFEWVQNIQQFTWDEERVNTELEKIMKDAHERIMAIVKQRGVSMRTAAFILAIGRVAKATVMRGI
jgi:glutamate dehydrogenase (NAD(P)+)